MSKDKHIVSVLPNYLEYDYMTLGSFAYSTKKERWILDEYAIDHNGEIETPGHHFNAIMSDVQIVRKDYNGTPLSYPFKAIPGPYPYCFYVDISKAYYQIARVFGVNPVVREGRYIGFGDNPPDEIFGQNKLLRALLVSGSYPQSTLTEWKNHEFQYRKFPNRLNNPGLRRCIFGTLHAIQSDISPYSVYCHTDGFIIPSWHIRTVCRLLEDKWGVLYSLKGVGITHIYGVGSYRIGPHSTSRRHSHRHGGKDGIRYELAQWYYEQWTQGRKRSKFDLSNL